MPSLRHTSIAVILSILSSRSFVNAHQSTQDTVTVESPRYGVSASCAAAMNSTIDCPKFLSRIALNGATLDTDEVTALCIDSCYASLVLARSHIAGACTAGSDVIIHQGSVYPATLMIDTYLLAYNVSCQKDSASGAFCDPLILSWANKHDVTSQESCSECWLSTQAYKLNHPLGYDEKAVENYAALTSSCKATIGYAVSSPTAYALSTAATSEVSLTSALGPQCTSTFPVKGSDTCHSVAQALNVSTFNLLHINNLDLYCHNFNTIVNTTLCVPPQCETYTWKALDTCAQIVAEYPGMTIPQFLSWNPNFNALCQNSPNFAGYEVCVSPPGVYRNT